MTLAEIYQQFAAMQSWEARYRLLVQLSRDLPIPTADELATLPEIHGCESRLWFDFHLEPRRVCAYSEARLMQGILQIVCLVLLEKSAAELAEFDLHALFDELRIAPNLTATRLNGLHEIQQIIAQQIHPHA